ncbi:hypothetical protein FRB93_014013 [Tulasnella sp. JGI-2019a]|nr:hypothetical protein FRB93_014013 [Tulasnella sp. JGI-2019a]
MLKLWRGASSSNQPTQQDPKLAAFAPPEVEAAIPAPIEDGVKTKDPLPQMMEPAETLSVEESSDVADFRLGAEQVKEDTPKIPEVTAAVTLPTAVSDNGATTETGGDSPQPPRTVSEGTQTTKPSPMERVRSLSLRSFGFFYGRSTPNLPTTIEDGTDADESEVVTTTPSLITQPAVPNSSPFTPPPPTPVHHPLKKAKRPTRAQKKTTSYALLLRSIIIGIPYSSTGRSKPPPMKKLKSELLKPKDANRLIAEVRDLPTPDTSHGVLHGTLRGLNGKLEEKDIPVVPNGRTPIHAVCLDCTDEEADDLHFNRLTSASGVVKTGGGSTTLLTLTPEVAQTGPTLLPNGSSSGGKPVPNIAQADLSSIIPVLQTIRLIDLVSQSIETIGTPANDFGFGQSVEEGGGFLAGAIPSASLLAESVVEVGQQLLSLGFATSAAVVPNHVGVYPPKDRLSVLSYWWGYEVVIPPPSMKYLADCKSIQNAALNFLTAFALFNSGVRELLPFVRYVSQFMDFEWNSIKAQNKGKGVVCAATWVMPAALVPRPWDFEDPPATAKPNPKGKSTVATGVAFRPDTLPGTQVIVPAQPEPELTVSRQPSSSSIPMVTLSPPTLLESLVTSEPEPGLE